MSVEASRLLATADPFRAEVALRAGLAALDHGMEEEARPLLERSAAAHPGDARLWQTLGLLLRAAEDLAPALDAFARAAALAPGDALIAHGHARVTMEAGLPAVALFDRAHALAPTDGEILLGRAAAQMAEAGAGVAADGLEPLLRQHRDWIDGHRTLSRLRWMAGDRDSFTASFDRALAATPRAGHLWRALIDLLIEAELYQHALPVIARAREQVGASASLDALETVCVAEVGEVEEADRRFATLGPLSFALQLRYIRHLLRAGRPREAVALVESLIPVDEGGLLWPYLATGWRLLDDPRWMWLEGDPRLVGVYDLTAHLPPLDRLAEVLRGLHCGAGQPIEQSVRGGSQTDGPLFARIEPEIRALRTAVREAVERHIAALPPPQVRHPLLSRPRAAVRFSGSWSVRLSGGGRHANHVHPHGWFSSAFYVALPARREHEPEDAGWLTLGEPQAELGVTLPPFRAIEPKPGRLVLFPPTMWHGTKPFADGERLTVAFDVAPPRS